MGSRAMARSIRTNGAMNSHDMMAFLVRQCMVQSAWKRAGAVYHTRSWSAEGSHRLHAAEGIHIYGTANRTGRRGRFVFSVEDSDHAPTPRAGHPGHDAARGAAGLRARRQAARPDDRGLDLAGRRCGGG